MPKSFGSVNRTLTRPSGVSAIHSPFTFFSDRASPEAQRGKFSGTEAKS